MSAPIARNTPSLAPLPQVDRSKEDPALVRAAEGMEALFLDYMMQTMRQTVPENAMGLDSSASKIYQGMLDSEYAQTAVKGGGIGLADQIIAYMKSERYNQDRSPTQGAQPRVPQGNSRSRK